MKFVAFVVVVCGLLACQLVTSFFVPTSTSSIRSMARRARRNDDDKQQQGATVEQQPWKQQPGESEFAYLKRLQQLASNPNAVITPTTTTTPQNATATPKTKSGYVPIETWNEQKYKKTNLTAEERLQFDCQRQGDRFRQNEILRNNLKYFG